MCKPQTTGKLIPEENQKMDVRHNYSNRFVSKLFHIVDSDEPAACWVPGGKIFLILDVQKFSETVLPKYFRHNKFTSFVRQLNLYGFSKLRVRNPDALIPNNDNRNHEKRTQNLVCFHHRYFRADEPELLERIRRTPVQHTPIIAKPHFTSEEIEMESMQEQMRCMTERMESMSAEFETKLQRAKIDLEIDYLRRIRAIEVCYKELATTIMGTRQQLSPPPTSFLEGSPQQSRAVSAFPGTTAQGGIPPLLSKGTSSLLLTANNTAEGYFLEQRPTLLQILNKTRLGANQACKVGEIDAMRIATKRSKSSIGCNDSISSKSSNIDSSSATPRGQKAQDVQAREKGLSLAFVNKQKQKASSMAYMNALQLIKTLH